MKRKAPLFTLPVLLLLASHAHAQQSALAILHEMDTATDGYLLLLARVWFYGGLVVAVLFGLFVATHVVSAKRAVVLLAVPAFMIVGGALELWLPAGAKSWFHAGLLAICIPVGLGIAIAEAFKSIGKAIRRGQLEAEKDGQS